MGISDTPASGEPFKDLLADEARLRILLSVAFDYSWEMTPKGEDDLQIHMLQDPSADLGLPPGEFRRTFTAREWLQRMHPDDGQPIDRLVQWALRRREVYQVEYRTRRADGEYTWWEERGAPAEFRDGRPVRWVGVVRNITERKQAEDDLRRALQKVQALKAELEAENVALRAEIESTHASDEVVGKSAALKRVLREVEQVAGTNAPVLITGETGTGKELLARAIHRASPRRERPLVTVNCAALAPTLVESELFGHEKGAFTGAGTRRFGRFERAHKGTILLDEVGELAPDVQAKLLRVLQTGEFERVGSSETVRVDVRVIAATNRDLEQDVKRGRFRQDLYYRLRVFPIHVPPLRERREDIPLLVAYLVEKKGPALGKRVNRIPRGTMEVLTAYDWPGNVREMENVIERGLILSRGPALVVESAFVVAAREPGGATIPIARLGGTADPTATTLAEAERAHILRICEACGWRIKGPGAAAERLGLNASTLYFRMKKLGIKRPSRLW
jgi:transcriptional regulator with GAF, ATPase, and Fis domain